MIPITPKTIHDLRGLQQTPEVRVRHCLFWGCWDFLVARQEIRWALKMGRIEQVVDPIVQLALARILQNVKFGVALDLPSTLSRETVAIVQNQTLSPVRKLALIQKVQNALSSPRLAQKSYYVEWRKKISLIQQTPDRREDVPSSRIEIEAPKLPVVACPEDVQAPMEDIPSPHLLLSQSTRPSQESQVVGSVRTGIVYLLSQRDFQIRKSFAHK